MSDGQKKAALLCILSFLLGCLLVSTGCAVHSKTELKAAPPTIFPHDLTHPVTGYDLDNVATLEVEACVVCGFGPWTD